MRNIILYILVGTLATGCINFNTIPTVDSKDFLRNKNGGIVKDCQGRIMFKNDEDNESFWRVFNLPKGTTEFTCIDGKAYLPEKVPPKN
ncbi:hypothetical protein RFI36_10785 [Acinetobacter gerneri]|uniref:Lipoprotein n=1 Tax=Acinetobacter gerneri TaxID=202952 RepID=A0AAW8JHB1_9GAMM|nr:hypothetical protein [Acinetobacter gerneri]MDQ9010221.1 hypothetical protein [Acinetobacter gerneri]MDQ9014366.1 hypothetical protein [Acinetobacter gerneri]MDQ9025537.1 hypothetical protein [Acinetobacter gerneri]MDQ9052780.1 hypothetical protein [Acinetobacter gerneri]MDQ9060436.1 hypothetical protein [Acinetobacter gerneri]